MSLISSTTIHLSKLLLIFCFITILLSTIYLSNSNVNAAISQSKCGPKKLCDLITQDTQPVKPPKKAYVQAKIKPDKDTTSPTEPNVNILPTLSIDPKVYQKGKRVLALATEKLSAFPDKLEEMCSGTFCPLSDNNI